MEAEQNDYVTSISFELPLWGSRPNPNPNDGIIHQTSIYENNIHWIPAKRLL
jgi:hypothetical protein